ncbi:MAG: YciI family protein, partial [Prosthecobacter sp.]|nr:YciI family protein [Prosthecobacter sp.]
SMPKFIMLLHDSGTFPPDISPDEIQAIIQRYVAWKQKVLAHGRLMDGHKLADGAGRVLRGTVGSPKVTDGPYAETKEHIGGILILEARDLNHAIQLMSKHPGVKAGPFEIRPAEDLTGMIRESEQRRAGGSAGGA